MKNYLLPVLFMLTNFLFSQNFKENKIPKGSYTQNSTSGIYIFDDNTFALYAYATLVFGEYKLQNDSIDFIPFQPEHQFTILGRENKSIQKGIQLTFEKSFMNLDSIYIKFNNNTPFSLLESNIDKGHPYYITNIDNKSNLITFIQEKQNSEIENNTNTYTFNLNSNFNDFLLFYDSPRKEINPFSGKVVTKNNQTIIISSWGDLTTENNEDTEMTTFLNRYKKEFDNNKIQNDYYFNDRMKKATGYDQLSEEENIFSIDNYIFDSNSNKYIRKDIYKKQKNYIIENVPDYHDESIILKYHKLNLSLKSFTNLKKLKKGKNILLFKSNINDRDKKEETEPTEIYLDKPMK